MTIFYLAVCQNCFPVLPMPFYDAQKRDDWAKAHAEGTGHSLILEEQAR